MQGHVVRILGFLMMVSGWLIAVVAVAILAVGPAQFTFLLVSGGIEVVGFVLIARSYLPVGGRAR